MKLYKSEIVELKEIYTPDLKKEIVAAPASDDAIRMMIKMTDGDSS